MQKRFGRPSPSMIVAMCALMVALGGTSYAAVTITGKNVKNSSLTGSDIKNSSLTGSDVKNSSLTSGDIKNGSIVPADIKGGVLPAGPQGPTGPEGPKGDKGDANVFPYSFRLSSGGSKIIADADGVRLTARCVINSTYEAINNRDAAYIEISTTADDASYYDSWQSFTDPDFDKADSPDLVAQVVDGTGTQKNYATAGSTVAVSAGGSVVALQGNLLGINLPGQTGKCSFGGSVMATGLTG